MTQCFLVSHNTPLIIRHQWVGYVPRKGETILQQNGQRWLVNGVELSWNDKKGEIVTLSRIRLYPLIEKD